MVFSSSSSTYEDTPGTSDGSEFQSNPEHSRSFRVVIAGAGVGGLVISHALTRAGIEHVVLEKGVVAPNWGASISIWANGARILHQLGCWDAIQAASLPLRMIYIRDRTGKCYSAEPCFYMMTERYS
jgi:2-polyprenyl-6-methoxyphenol hydroxylase-like FAD-dependent oxidoreductase